MRVKVCGPNGRGKWTIKTKVGWFWLAAQRCNDGGCYDAEWPTYSEAFEEAKTIKSAQSKLKTSYVETEI